MFRDLLNHKLGPEVSKKSHHIFESRDVRQQRVSYPNSDSEGSRLVALLGLWLYRAEKGICHKQPRYCTEEKEKLDEKVFCTVRVAIRKILAWDTTFVFGTRTIY